MLSSQLKIMSVNATIAKNTTYLTAALVVQKALSFVFFLLIARTLGEVGTGEYVAAFSLSSLFGILIDLGVGPVLVRDIARHPERSEQYLGNALSLKLLLSGGVYGLLLITVLILAAVGAGHPPLGVVAIAGVAMIIDSFTLSMTSVLRGWQSLLVESLSIAASKTVVIVVGVAVLLVDPGAVGVALATTIGSATAFLMLWRALARDGRIVVRPHWNKEIIKELWGQAKPFALAGIFSTLYGYGDSVLLSVLQGSVAVGLYSVASKTMNAFQFIPSALIAAVYPAMSRDYHVDRQRLETVFTESMRWMLVISAPLGVGLFLVADQFVTRLGAGYLPAAQAVRILMPSLVFVFLSFPLGALLNATDRQRWQTGVLGFGAALNIVLNIVLIPRWSFIGASWSWFIANAVVLIIGFILSRRVLIYAIRPLLLSTIRVVTAVAIMGIVVMALHAASLVLSIVVGGAVYAICLLLTKEITREDLAVAKTLFRANNKTDDLPAITEV